MNELTVNKESKFSKENILIAGKYLLENWYMLLLAIITGALIGYFFVIRVKPVYTATYNFVLSTDQGSGGSMSGLASQLGINTRSDGDIFSGDNIIELFKSRKLISTALLTVVDSQSNKTLLNIIAQKHFPKLYLKIHAFGPNPNKYSAAQTRLFRKIISVVANSFLVFKKDKKLIFYSISSSDTDGEIAYFVAKYMLYQTSKYFIETKTKVTAASVALLRHEADSLSKVLSNAYNSSAAVTDRTYNLNPAISTQRSGIQFIQTKAAAYNVAYSDVLRNLESAKLSLQNATPLYRIIDEPELPLIPVKANKRIHVGLSALIAIILMTAILLTEYYIRSNSTNAFQR